MCCEWHLSLCLKYHWVIVVIIKIKRSLSNSVAYVILNYKLWINTYIALTLKNCIKLYLSLMLRGLRSTKLHCSLMFLLEKFWDCYFFVQLNQFSSLQDLQPTNDKKNVWSSSINFPLPSLVSIQLFSRIIFCYSDLRWKTYELSNRNFQEVHPL